MLALATDGFYWPPGNLTIIRGGAPGGCPEPPIVQDISPILQPDEEVPSTETFAFAGPETPETSSDAPCTFAGGDLVPITVTSSDDKC